MLRHSLSRYLIACALSFAAVVAAAAAAVILIDPYGVFAWISTEGFNSRKVRLTHSQFEVRSRVAAQLKADAWIIGNSRAEMGFDPMHPAFAQNGLVAYNLAVPGGGGLLSLKLAEALSTSQTPKRIILGVDFVDFPVRPDALEPPLAHYKPDALGDTLWTLRTVFSARAAVDALKTLTLQKDPYAAYLTQRGFNPIRDYVKETQLTGAYAMFAQRAQESAKVYANKPHSLTTTASETSLDWQALQATLELAKPGTTRVDVIIYPYHAQIRWLFAQYGLDSLFNDWRERLVKSAHTHAAKSGADIRVWDFSGFTPHHCEAVPPPNDRKTQLKWYWEGGHFKKELGDLVLDQLFASDAAALATLPQLGRVIIPDSLPTKVQQDQMDEARCRHELPGLLAEVERAAAKFKPMAMPTDSTKQDSKQGSK